MKQPPAGNPAPDISDKIITSIWKEEPRDGNSFYPKRSLCRGYDYYGELLGKVSFRDVVHLMLTGELPSEKEQFLLDLIMVAAANPGPRMWCTRAAMSAAVGKTTLANCLMAGLAGLGGEYFGAQDVEDAMRLFQQAVKSHTEHKNFQAREDLGNDMPAMADIFEKSDGRVPGYGLYFSERDGRAVRLMEIAEEAGLTGVYSKAARELEKYFSTRNKIWLTLPGAVAALLCDAGYQPFQGAGIFLLAGSAGLLAHAIEQLPRRWNEYPFWWDTKKHYRYEGPDEPPEENNQENLEYDRDNKQKEIEQ